MTFEERVEYTKRLHVLGVIFVAKDPSDLHFQAVATADHLAATAPNPGWSWIDEEARRAKALFDLGLDRLGRPR